MTSSERELSCQAHTTPRASQEQSTRLTELREEGRTGYFLRGKLHVKNHDQSTSPRDATRPGNLDNASAASLFSPYTASPGTPDRAKFQNDDREPKMQEHEVQSTLPTPVHYWIGPGHWGINTSFPPSPLPGDPRVKGGAEWSFLINPRFSVKSGDDGELGKEG
ncbi:hypothetical protein ACOMHN_019551 [Nucella lapillus]